MNFSVIIPIYNSPHLCTIIGNILSSDIQKFNFEIIIADDGSDEEYFYSYKSTLLIDSRIKYCYLGEKHGKFRAGEARNVGVKNSNYEILVFLDQDSCIHKEFFSEIEKKYIGGLLTGCMLGYNDHKKNITYELFQNFLQSGNISENSFKDIRESEIACFKKDFWRVSSTNMIINKKLFKQVGGFDTKMKGWGFEDVELGYRFHKMGIEINHDTELKILNLSPNLYSDNPKILNIDKITTAIKNLEYIKRKYTSQDIDEYIEVTLTLFKELKQKYGS